MKTTSIAALASVASLMIAALGMSAAAVVFADNPKTVTIVTCQAKVEDTYLVRTHLKVPINHNKLTTSNVQTTKKSTQQFNK